MTTVPLPTRKQDATQDGRVGIIDIGSNSVRLVVFDRISSSPVTVYNEKVLCGLARSLGDTGRLDPDGSALAARLIERFVGLSRAMDLARLDAIATAAVRDASDGGAFIEDVERRLGVAVKVLSGEEEAALAGLAVARTMSDADGVVGDLGGGSLELVEIGGDRIGEQATLPLGALRLARGGGTSAKHYARLIDETLAGVDWLDRLTGRTFFVVGGAWRALARLDIAQRDYPLSVIDHYTMTSAHALDLARLVARMGPESLDKIKNIGARRLETLPIAALLMERLLVSARPTRLVFSSSGIREGYLFSLMDSVDASRDALIDGCRAVGRRVGRFGEIGDALFAWTAPLFPDEDKESARWRHAACLLADSTWREHPDYRAAAAFHHAMQMSVTGLDHPGRCFIGLALFHRYGAPFRADAPSAPAAILDAAQIDAARRLGCALRVGMSLSGGAPGVVEHCRFDVRKKVLALCFEPTIAGLVEDLAEKRLRVLAEQMGLKPVIEPA